MARVRYVLLKITIIHSVILTFREALHLISRKLKSEFTRVWLQISTTIFQTAKLHFILQWGETLDIFVIRHWHGNSIFSKGGYTFMTFWNYECSTGWSIAYWYFQFHCFNDKTTYQQLSIWIQDWVSATLL